MASIITNLLGGGLLQGVSGLINSIRGKNPEDAAKLAEIAEKYQSDIIAADTAARVAQVDVNKAEAASSSLFVAGWRPWIGWVCGGAMFYAYIFQPFAAFVLAAFKVRFDSALLPHLDMTTMMPVLLGMLGLSTMRTYEK